MQLSDRIGRRMKLHDLHVLMAVVQAGSMNKAAALLHTTQPAISRSITELERAIGVRLLDRNPRGVEPTRYGRALLDGGAAMFDDLRQAVKNIEFMADPTAGEVRIACNPILATSFVSAIVDRLSRRHPRIRFHVLQGGGIAASGSERTKRRSPGRAQLGDLADERLDFECSLCGRVCGGGGHAKSVGSAAKDQACRPDERSVDLAAAGEPDRAGGEGGLRASGIDYPDVTVATVAPEIDPASGETGAAPSVDLVLRFPPFRRPRSCRSTSRWRLSVASPPLLPHRAALFFELPRRREAPAKRKDRRGPAAGPPASPRRSAGPRELQEGVRSSGSDPPGVVEAADGRGLRWWSLLAPGRFPPLFPPAPEVSHRTPGDQGPPFDPSPVRLASSPPAPPPSPLPAFLAPPATSRASENDGRFAPAPLPWAAGFFLPLWRGGVGRRAGCGRSPRMWRCDFGVGWGGVEPLTSSLRTRRSPN